MTPLPGSSQKAFSLVETVLALGIFVFSVLGVFGLLFAGMQSSREASQLTIGSGVVRDVFARVQVYAQNSSGFYPLSTNLFYDERGRPVDAGAHTNDYYKATVTLANLAVYPTNVDSSQMKSVNVKLFWPAPAYVKTNTYTFYISKLSDNSW